MSAAGLAATPYVRGVTETPPPSPQETARVLRRFRGAVHQVQDHVAAMLGVGAAARRDTVVAMLESNARRVPGYWIQLALSTGIATFGLVLNSTAVVIGAMLVSPLMGPLLELGMGFAVGSSLLVLRAALRVVVSVLFVVGGATVITSFVPFHEVTAEVAARTAPTALEQLAQRLDAPLRVLAEPLPAEPLTARRGADAEWLATATQLVGRTLRTDSLMACVRGPANGVAGRRVAATLRSAAAAQESRLALTPGPTWTLRIARGSCARRRSTPRPPCAKSHTQNDSSATNAGTKTATANQPALAS